MTVVLADHVLQLHMNLHGLCEAAWPWYCYLSTTLKTQGASRDNFASCVWWLMDNPLDPKSRNYFLLQIDDSLLIGRKARQHDDALAARYEMKDLEQPNSSAT